MTFHNTGKAPIPMRAVPLPSTAPPPPPACPGTYREAGTADRLDRFLDPDLTAAIDVHLAEHGTDGVDIDARALLILGPAGDTKTSTLRSHLSRRGVDALELSMATSAARPKVAPSSTSPPRTPSSARRPPRPANRWPCTVTISTPPFSLRARTRSGPSTRVCFEAHSKPCSTAADTFLDGNNRPIPIFFTANAIDGFPGPLIRDGRVRIKHFRPTWQRKAQMLTTALGVKNALDRRRLQCLAYLYRDQSVVWLTSLPTDLRHAAIARAVAKHGLDNHDAIRKAASPAKLDVRALFAAAKARRTAASNANDRSE